MARRAQLSDALVDFFEGGDDIRDMICVRYDLEQLEALWKQHGADILDVWIVEHPGTRPWAWWRWTASEPRRVLDGVERIVEYSWIWREYRNGVPGLRRGDPDRAACLVESQAAYLLRLGLLAPGEKSALTPADFAPEPVKPFLIFNRHSGSVLFVDDDDDKETTP
jgi:hypothetical protein